jgi:chromosomal replication initiator protein
LNVESIWQNTLKRLEAYPIEAESLSWLHEANLKQDAVPEQTANGKEMLSFWLQAPHKRAQTRFAQWISTLEAIMQELTGKAVTLVLFSEEEAPASSIQTLSERAFVPIRRTTDGAALYEISPRPEQQSEIRESPHPSGIYGRGNQSSEALTEEWDSEQRANILLHNRLNQRYTFDAFIVGNSNRLAHAASQAVAEAPGESYNPLFLYGGVGLGKTHLLHAIGHQGVQTGLAVLYVSSEQFTNEIVNAIRYRTTEEFRAKYRSVDILLVDDIQFIAGKESTEEEFFHTFNSLYEMSKQIVICSDRPPKAIVSLEERLRSRFEWGLIADIQPPDLETRMAILRVKADALRYRVPDEIISFIASRVQTNIRELEGCLNRLMAYQQLHRTELTLDIARQAISTLAEDVRETNLSSRQIAEVVAEFYHITLEAMCGKQRDKNIVFPRQVAMYLIRQETDISLLEIGQLFGGRDHSTVLHACEKIDRAVNINPALRREIVAIREQLMRE